MLPTFSICFCLVPSINELEMLDSKRLEYLMNQDRTRM